MHQKTKYYSFIIFLIMPHYFEASPPCTQPVAKVVSAQGNVAKQYSGTSEWQTVQADDLFCPGDKIRTERWSRATLTLSNNSLATLDQSTTLIFSEPEENTSTWLLNLMEGSVFFRSREPQRLNIQTPFINAVHKGTEFLVTVDAQQTKISVFDGQVAAENKAGRIQIKKGFAVIAQKNQAPRLQALTITPEDAVQWTLYYPPVIDYQHRKSSILTPSLKSALAAYQQGDIYQALTRLDEAPVTHQDSEYLTLKASLLLTVGRVDEAQNSINRALRIQHDHSTVFALQSIIAVAKNQQHTALDLALKAVTLNPKSSAAKIALSYAYQSLFKIEDALKATQQATQLAPDNALAWARLSELQLSTGDRDGALVSAQQAQTLNPKLARTQTILGFAALAQFDFNAGKKAFEQAIALDSSYPLARLGLGLAKIRKGALEEGTRDIETAVNLDPDNAVSRSYLGKAYYELRNKDYAGTEYKIAKEMDPKDPTPWYYDAILKQTTNRPVEALHDMQKAIDLNDNREVYRSRLLLNEDAAARASNHARIYNDLGFGRVALKQAWNSLGYDSTNSSAHRFLSDAYIGQPRFRVARASELLQAQLLQPINITPVQPQLTGENIGILNSTGPASLSVNEYDPMYTSNGAHVVLNGAYGSNNTITDNAIISGVYDQLSMSLGQFHYQTDGFRLNDDYKQDIYDAFAQYAFSPDLSVQIEFKSEDVRAGDVPFRLNGFHRENLSQTIEQDTARLGGHYKIDVEQDFIVSAFYSTRNDSITNRQFRQASIPRNSFNQFTLDESENKSYQAEMQYMFHPESFDITTGVGYLNSKNDKLSESRGVLAIPPFTVSKSKDFTFSIPTQRETHYFNAYGYSKQNLLPGLTTVLGLSFDSYDDDLIARQQLNPKFGVIWNPVKNLTLRSAAFRTLNRPLAANQTIEPTQIAGFNQFYDGNNGTSAWQYGFGIDYNPIKSIYFGGEVTWRDGKQPVTENTQFIDQGRNESAHLAYFYWVPFEWMSFRSEYRYEKFSRDFTLGLGDRTNPRSIETQQVPLSLNLFHDSGLFAKLTETYVNQHVATVRDLKETGFPLKYQSENFWTFDAAIGYRFPKRIGIISLEGRNLFDYKFNYQSTFDASGPQLSPYIPERQLFVKLSLFY
ncbi:MAG: FecR domain-containing protein [Methylococcales bacterium]|nr:FecR domain-containing protein [Methylococcales bacterium]